MRLIDAYKVKCDREDFDTYADYITAFDAINEAPTVDAVPVRHGGWIPCNERLPEENKEVLINLAWGIDIGEYREGGWHSEWVNHYDDDNVIAWMPLPKPYKAERKDNETD